MITIRREGRIVKADVTLTSSKSITNRALIIRALCNKKFVIQNPADAEDSKNLENILNDLPREINVENAGTSFRFLTAFLSIQSGTFVLDGNERMKQRPVGELVNALQSIGAEIEYTSKENYPPLKIAGRILKGGKVKIDASESSQFISALLLIAPQLENGLEIEMTGKVNSWPYIEMTLSLMSYFGVAATLNVNRISVLRQDYLSRNIKIENDWSSASFWYEIAALSEKAEIKIEGINDKSIQGDAVISEIMKQFGVLTEFRVNDIFIYKRNNSIMPLSFDYDFSSCPDLVVPVATICAVLKIPSMLSGVKNLRIKESDRLFALKNELEKNGVEIILNDDSLSITPAEKKLTGIFFRTYNDHRLIMAFAPLALLYDEVKIDDHLAVSKSYPGFWSDLSKAGFDYELSENSFNLNF